LEREQLLAHLTHGEKLFLSGADSSVGLFKMQVEALWALSWCLSLVPALSFADPCSASFVSMLPDLKAGEAGATLREKAHLRALLDISKVRDLAYVLHWGLRQSALDGRPAPLPEYVVAERRRALEWLLSEEPWDQVSLDT
jgi:hypothetical protein